MFLKMYKHQLPTTLYKEELRASTTLFGADCHDKKKNIPEKNEVINYMH